MKKLIPIGKRVVVQTKKTSQETDFGIVLPENLSKTMPQIGEIIEMGNDIKEDVKIGDIVVFREFSPTDIEIEGEKFLILESQDILAKVS